MAHVKYHVAKEAFLKGTIDLSTDDIRAALVMTGTTCDTENDGIATCANFTTADEFDGVGYTSGGVALTGEAVAIDTTNDRAEFDAADVTGLSYANGTRQIAGILLIKFNTTFADSMPIAYIDSGGFPVNGASLGSIVWNQEGVLQLA